MCVGGFALVEFLGRREKILLHRYLFRYSQGWNGGRMTWEGDDFFFNYGG